MNDVRPVRDDDVDEVAAMVATAFVDDPAWNFMCGQGSSATRTRFARALLVPRVRAGTAWMTDDRTAVAMWDRRSPGWRTDPDDARIWAEFREAAGPAVWSRIETYEHALEAKKPHDPYWYLGVLATRADVRGRGLAAAVMGPGLAAAAVDGWDCWLETSTTANKDYYTKRGFTQSREVLLPSGPTTWWLRRPHADA